MNDSLAFTVLKHGIGLGNVTGLLLGPVLHVKTVLVGRCPDRMLLLISLGIEIPPTALGELSQGIRRAVLFVLDPFKCWIL